VYKVITPTQIGEEPTIRVIDSRLEKVASNLPQNLLEFISNLESRDGKVYVLMNALGSSEFYGSNKNGDAFPESALNHDGEDYGHKTFVTMGNAFTHHKNKDPEKAIGKPIFTTYDEPMRRVLLVVEIDRTKAPRIAEKIDSGKPLDVSMGCRVAYDQCSVCGHKAKRMTEYCKHLKTQMNRILPDGRRVCAINPFPKFFDISFVIVGADRTAKTLKKVASAGESVESGAALGLETYGEDKAAGAKAAEDKKADIYKEITETLPASEEIMADAAVVRATEPDIPTAALNKVASNYPPSEILATTAMAGIRLKPHEFQRICLVKAGEQKLADILDRNGIEIPETCPDCDRTICNHYDDIDATMKISSFNPAILRDLGDVVENRSFFEPHMRNRMMKMAASRRPLPMRKKASDEVAAEKVKEMGKDVAGLLSALGLSYLAYQSQLPREAGKVTKLLKARPYIAPLVLGGLVGLRQLIDNNPDLMDQDRSEGEDIDLGGKTIEEAYADRISGASNDDLLNMPSGQYNLKMASSAGFWTVVGPTGAAYLASAATRRKEREGRRLSPLEKMIRDYPLPVGIGATLGLSKMQKAFGKMGSAHKKTASPSEDGYISTLLKDVLSGIYRATPAGIIGSIGDKAIGDVISSAASNKESQ
jgi:hypothetical protein